MAQRVKAESAVRSYVKKNYTPKREEKAAELGDKPRGLQKDEFSAKDPLSARIQQLGTGSVTKNIKLKSSEERKAPPQPQSRGEVAASTVKGKHGKVGGTALTKEQKANIQAGKSFNEKVAVILNKAQNGATDAIQDLININKEKDLISGRIENRFGALNDSSYVAKGDVARAEELG